MELRKQLHFLPLDYCMSAAQSIGITLISAFLLTACSSVKGPIGSKILPGTDVTVTSEPAGASILIDGIDIGTTPATIPANAFPTGWHGMTYQAKGIVELKKQGCETARQRFNDAALIAGIHVELSCNELPSSHIETLRPNQSTTQPPRVKERLKTLKSLRDDGDISEQEYQNQRRRILESI